MIPLFKSSLSLLKSILTLNEIPTTRDPDLPDSILEIAQDNNLDTVVLVEDTISSFLPAKMALDSIGKKLVFGLRVSFVDDVDNKTDESFNSSHKNIIFPKNYKGYKSLIKLSTLAAYANFYKEPRLSYENLHDHWSDDLVLGVPFYDSFLHKNTLSNSFCVPDFRDIKPTVFIESNELPFDYLIEKAALDFAKINNLTVEKAKSIYYKNREDYDAYLALKCLNRKQFGTGRTLDNPGLEHMSSREFCWESFLEQKND